jgi:DNA-binding SARP family transcriptional activator/tetratricopeptide (TPR) repeat protein
MAGSSPATVPAALGLRERRAIEDSCGVLRVQLGGGLRLEAGGVELQPPASRRARGVLAYLALNPGPHARAQLAARFWPDVLDESARTSLRAALSELRRALGPAADHVVATRDTVALDGDDLTVDARAFEQALRQGDPAGALEACRAPILDGFDEDWAHEARRVHTERLAEAFELLASASTDPAEAVRLTREQVALDPLAEAANRRLIERLAQAGDRAAALTAGARFAERLRTTLALAPSPETRALLEALRRAPPARAPAPPPALTRVHDTEFVGRAAELERVRASWADIELHGTRRIVLISGEPGVGKTRLAHRFATQVLDAGAVVLLGRCWEEPLAPFEPFSEALRQVGAADVLRPGDDVVAGARHRLFDAVDAALADLAGERGLLLVIDDLHWADRGTLLLTSFLLRSERPPPLLVLGTYRDTELGRHSPLTGALAELQRGGALERIGLRGLAESEVAALARSLLGDDEVAARVHARTDGNAFFVEQVLRGLTESPEVPESVRHAVGVRLSRLGGEANELLAAAAVLGPELDPRALAGTAAVAPDAAEAALDDVLRARLLRPASAGGRFEFAHALVREAVYDELNVLRRARLHRRAAEALRELGEDRHVEEIASHLFHAASTTDAREVSDMLVRAGRRALDRLAYEDAAERFARAIEALELAEADDEAGPVLVARGDALMRAGEPSSAREAFSAAAQLARRRGDAELLAEAALGFAGLGIAIVDLDTETIARLEEALDLLASGDAALRSRLQGRLAVELYYAPDRRRSERLSADAVATARASGDPRALASALNARHVALWRPDRCDERLATATAMIAAARDARDPHHELQARNWRVTDLFELGDMPACREEIARHARLADELRLPSFQWYTPLWAATEATLAGRFADAQRLTTEARERGTRAGDRNAELFAGMVQELAHVQRLEFHRTDMAFLEDKLANSPASPAYQSYLVWILAGLGRADEARRHLDDWIRRELAFDANWLSAQAEAAEAVVLLGDPTHAQVLYDRLAPYAGRPATAGRAVSSYGVVDRHLGGLAAVLGRRDDAIRHLRTAIDRDAELGCAVWRLHGQRRLHRLAPDDALAAEATATARAIGLPQLVPG